MVTLKLAMMMTTICLLQRKASTQNILIQRLLDSRNIRHHISHRSPRRVALMMGLKTFKHNYFYQILLIVQYITWPCCFLGLLLLRLLLKIACLSLRLFGIVVLCALVYCGVHNLTIVQLREYHLCRFFFNHRIDRYHHSRSYVPVIISIVAAVLLWIYSWSNIWLIRVLRVHPCQDSNWVSWSGLSSPHAYRWPTKAVNSFSHFK